MKHHRKYSSDSDKSKKSLRKHHNKHKIEIKVHVSKPISDFKNHLRLEHLKIKHRYQEPFLSIITERLSEYVGPIQHLDKIQNNSKHDSLSIVVGFKYDIDAYNFVNGKAGQLQIQYEKNKIPLKPVPTEAFKIYIENKSWTQPMVSKKQQISQNKKKSRHSRSQSSSSSQSSRSRNHKNNKRKKHESSQGSRSQSLRHRDIKKKTVLMFGIPTFLKQYQIQLTLKNFKEQKYTPIIASKWKKIDNSNCQYLELTLQNKKADKLLKLRQGFTINDYPVVILDGTAKNNQAITQQLKDFQFFIDIPHKVNPYQVLKRVNQCGKVVQMIAQEKIVDGTCQKYCITLNNASVVNQLKKISKTSLGVIISQVNEAQLVYRPTFNTCLYAFKRNEQ